jgi:hypothetical protein
LPFKFQRAALHRGVADADAAAAAAEAAADELRVDLVEARAILSAGTFARESDAASFEVGAPVHVDSP